MIKPTDESPAPFKLWLRSGFYFFAIWAVLAGGALLLLRAGLQVERQEGSMKDFPNRR